MLDPLGDALEDEGIPVIEIERRRDEQTVAVPEGRLHDGHESDQVTELTFTGLVVHLLDPKDLGAVAAQLDVVIVSDVTQPCERGCLNHPCPPPRRSLGPRR